MTDIFNIPNSANTVSVSIIDSTTMIKGVPPQAFMKPQYPGHDSLILPSYSFLIHNERLDRTIVYDLAVRKDWETSSPPALQQQLKLANISVQKDIRDILEEGGVNLESIEAVVWSHWHFDHIGDPSRFEKNTKLIVGPGFKQNLLPCYPTNKNSTINEKDLMGRELYELEFSDTGPKVGRFPAFDYFGDGSFYFLDTPGHAVGHIAGFARVSSNPDSFILMGGDACHHGGELRPSPQLPLPDYIVPNPLLLGRTPAPPCPGAIFEALLTHEGRDKPFYCPAGPIHHDQEETRRTIEKFQEADRRDDIFVVLAHDEVLLDIVDFFPNTANDFLNKGWVQKSRWLFLRDLARPAGYAGEVIIPQR
jgi:glyoxylase-like metal-dependent hydrolase (beta-lactamase superfamily II)